jgi:UDP-glucose 4-epimerase
MLENYTSNGKGGSMARVLVCGGAGYIGSHTAIELHRKGHFVVVLDNLCRGHKSAVPKDIPLIRGDIGDSQLVLNTLSEHRIDAVMHFAAHLAVGESVKAPLKYYSNNIAATVGLLSAVHNAGTPVFIFSSSASVYGTPKEVPICEDAPLAPINPYGFSKVVVERMLQDCSHAFGLKYIALRYFNAAGADPEGAAGIHYRDSTNLIPLVLGAALGKLEKVTIFGNDYPTPDGTCIRDYIHVTDLAGAHIKALDHLLAGGISGSYNLGNGKGYSVLEVIDTCRLISGKPIPTTVAGRREGDPAQLIADPAKAEKELDWHRRFPGLDSIVSSAWRWQVTHPDGYPD